MEQMNEQLITFDINQVKVTDLDGVIYQIPLGKSLGNACFQFFSTIEWDDYSRKIHKNEPVDFRPQDLAQFIELIRSPQLTIPVMVRASLLNYIETLKHTDNGIKVKTSELEKSSS